MANIYKILDSEGNEINRIVAEEDFMTTAYPDGNYEFVEAQEAPPASSPKRRLDTPLFMMRFTANERIALREASTSDTPYAVYLTDLLLILNDPRLAYVENDDPELVASMQMLVQVGLLTQERSDAIMDF